jgi:hypothetical protein
MEALQLWPDQPVLSLVVLWLASTVALWVAREPMLQLFERLGRHLEEAFEAAGSRCKTSAEELRKRSRAALLAAGGLELQSKLEKEFHRIDQGFSERLGQYSGLQRQLADLLTRLEGDYQRSGDTPPEVPGWAAAVESIAAIPSADDPKVHKILDSVRRSLEEAQKKALDTYRKDTSLRHKILERMRPLWKDARGLLERMSEAVSGALETTSRVNGYIDEYGRIRNDDRAAARALSYSAAKLFAISLLVLGVALGGAFVNFQLIALPMSELVPAGSRLMGIPMPSIAALVLVLMEIAAGIFAMEMLGVTNMFAQLGHLSTGRRRLILGCALCGLFLLAGIESTLAILREQMVVAESALKMSLGGVTGEAVAEPVQSKIPVIGQAVLGFILPWILAMMAIPLEMLIATSGPVLLALFAVILSLFASATRLLGHMFQRLAAVVSALYDVYIVIPLQIERLIKRGGGSPLTRGKKLRNPTEESGRQAVVR